MAIKKPKEGEKLKYFTRRKFENNGKATIWVFEGEENANVEYTCPFCGFSGELQQEWKRPFNFKCGKCNKLIRVPKLK